MITNTQSHHPRRAPTRPAIATPRNETQATQPKPYTQSEKFRRRRRSRTASWPRLSLSATLCDGRGVTECDGGGGPVGSVALCDVSGEGVW